MSDSPTRAPIERLGPVTWCQRVTQVILPRSPDQRQVAPVAPAGGSSAEAGGGTLSLLDHDGSSPVVRHRVRTGDVKWTARILAPLEPGTGVHNHGTAPPRAQVDHSGLIDGRLEVDVCQAELIEFGDQGGVEFCPPRSRPRARLPGTA